MYEIMYYDIGRIEEFILELDDNEIITALENLLSENINTANVEQYFLKYYNLLENYFYNKAESIVNEFFL